jgi:short-subunit dehydrogenase
LGQRLSQSIAEFTEKYGRWALVTGANTGIGKAIATELASRGINIIGVARRQVLLDRLKEELEETYGVEVRTIRADLTDPDSISKIEIYQIVQAVLTSRLEGVFAIIVL